MPRSRTALSTAEPHRKRVASVRLTRQAVGGERSAFEAIFERYHQEIYRYCLAIVRSREDAEDALQATMAAALHSLPGEERDLALRPWLFRVAHNESISLVRARTNAVAGEELIESAAGSVASELEGRHRLRQLVADLQALPERQRSAIVMRELSGLSYAEIGDALDGSEGVARQTVYEARSALFAYQEGREMECERVRKAISAQDRRRLRGRKLRAHLRTCEGCSGFEELIARRSGDLHALFPPLPAVAASGLLAGLVGGSGGAGVVGAGAVGAGVSSAGAGLSGLLGSGLAGSAAIKGASVIAAAAVAAGAAELIDLPNPIGGSGEGLRESMTAPRSGHGRSAVPEAAGGGVRNSPSPGSLEAAAGGRGDSGGAPTRSGGSGNASSAGQQGDNDAATIGAAPGNATAVHGSSGNSPGSSASAPGQTGSAGNSASAPGHSGESPGNSASAPGHSGESPGNSASAPGQTGSAGNSASAPGHSGESPGHSASAPGQTGSAGNSASAPGQTKPAGGNSGDPADPLPPAKPIAPPKPAPAAPPSEPGSAAKSPKQPPEPPGHSQATGQK